MRVVKKHRPQLKDKKAKTDLTQFLPPDDMREEVLIKKVKEWLANKNKQSPKE